MKGTEISSTQRRREKCYERKSVKLEEGQIEEEYVYVVYKRLGSKHVRREGTKGGR